MEISPREWLAPVTYWVPQGWGLTPGKQVPLAGLESCGKPGLCSWECTHACLLLKQGGESGLKLHRMQAGFLRPPWCAPQPEMSAHSCPTCSWRRFTLGQGLPLLQGKLSCEGQRQLRPGAASEQGKGNNYWCLLRQCIRSDPGLWLWVGLPSAFSTIHAKHLHQPHLLHSTAAHYGEGYSGQEESSAVRDKGSTDPEKREKRG